MNLQEMDLQNIIYMKYGVHASETVAQIIARKEEEIKSCGWSCWGYGGTLCHPITQVQPFVQRNAQHGKKTYVVMEYTQSELWNTSARAVEYSTDKETWCCFPNAINVYGSKYALCFKDIQKCNFELDLNAYEIAVGASRGKILGEYIKARVDKGCADRVTAQKRQEKRIVHISLIAELVEPFAVFVR